MFHARRQFCMKHQSLFSGKMSSAELTQRLVKVKLICKFKLTCVI